LKGEVMQEFESDSEILEYAISREIEAFQFYTALSKRMEKPEMQKLLKELAEEELEHKARLELEVIKTGKTVNVADPHKFNEEEYTIEGEFIFDMGFRELLAMAIEKEKMAFELYAGMSGKVLDEDSRETLLELAEEEVKHKQRFEYEYEVMLKNGEFKKGQN
jgi:rubrerythrin